jgi:ribosomal protein S18 acetylase RimI-like enzyme
MQTTLTRAHERDLELLLEFMEEYYHFDHLPFDRQKASMALSQLLKNDALGSVWLIQAGPATAGYVVLTHGYSLEYHGRDAFIDEIYLREAFRGQGCGRTAMNLVAEEACRLGVQALHLEVERENRAAQAFYRKVGFGDHGRYLMTKRLDGETA